MLDAVKYFPSKDIEPIMTGFENAFGEHEAIKIVTRPVHNPEKTSVQIVDKDGLMEMDALLNMHIKNPFYNTTMDVAYMALSAKGTL